MKPIIVSRFSPDGCTGEVNRSTDIAEIQPDGSARLVRLPAWRVDFGDLLARIDVQPGDRVIFSVNRLGRSTAFGPETNARTARAKAIVRIERRLS
jgi:hypothetical protein